MNSQKGYNSILFLTTLSVYLGLVFVGASPLVLAQQAALTQKFEIQKEIEIEDDLDKNPDDESLDSFLLARLDLALNEFVEDLRKLDGAGNYKSNSGFSTGFSSEFCSFGAESSDSSISLSKNDYLYDSAIRLRKRLDLSNGGRSIHNLPDFIESSIETAEGTCKYFGGGISIDKSEVGITFKISQFSHRSLITAQNLNTLFSIKAENAQNPVTKQFYENTKAKAENQYVIVSTRLARGSLDSLVKVKR